MFCVPRLFQGSHLWRLHCYGAVGVLTRAVEVGAAMGRFQDGRAVSVWAVRDRVGEVGWG
jgi:hypothetical protein